MAQYERIAGRSISLKKLIKEAKGVFGGSDKESLSSVLENFYDDLKLTTKGTRNTQPNPVFFNAFRILRKVG